MCSGLTGQFFYYSVSHHFVELGIGAVAYHGLGLGCRDGVLGFTFCVSFVALADCLGHFHGLLGLHVDLGEALTHSVFFLVEGDLFALRGGDNPFASCVVTDRESICLYLGEGEEVCRTRNKPNRSWYQPFLVAKLVPALQSARRVVLAGRRLSRCFSVNSWWKLDVLSRYSR